MEWCEIVTKSKMGVIQIKLIRQKFWKIDGHIEDYEMTEFRRDCLALVFSRLDKLRALERYEELEGVDLHSKNHLKPYMSLYRRYRELSRYDLIMTAIYYPSGGFDRLMFISAKSAE
jgi:hypothetical protein